MNFDNEPLSTVINFISNNTIKQTIKLELERQHRETILSKRSTIQTTNQLIVL